MTRSGATPRGDPEHPVVAFGDVLAGHQRQQLRRRRAAPLELLAVQDTPSAASASWTSASTSASRAAGSSQSHGGLPGVA